MNIAVNPLPAKMADSAIINSTVIVVDVLRSATSIVWAIKNKAGKVIPVREAGEAVALAARLGLSDCVLAGEIDSKIIHGFALGNSPMEYTEKAVKGKTVVLSTSNGTAAIQDVKSAKNVLIAGMVNASSAAKRAAQLGNDVIIVCGGSDGRVSGDDLCAAGAIIEAIQSLSLIPPSLTDVAMICAALFRDAQEGRFDLSLTCHYRQLVSLGFDEDVRFCLQRDITDVVPEYRDGVIQ